MPYRIVFENKLVPTKAQSLATGSSPSRRLLDIASAVNETLRGMSDHALKSVPDVHDVTFEGLPRHEFQGTSRQPDRRGNYRLARRHKPIIVRKLTLASGPLPLPGDANMDTFHDMRSNDKQSWSEPCIL